MINTGNRSSRRAKSRARWGAGLIAMALIAAACSSDEKATPATEAAVTTAAPTATEPAATEPPATEPASTEPAATDTAATEAPETTAEEAPAGDGVTIFPDLAPPTGDEIVIGLVNSEGGALGLDFPEIRLYIEAFSEYLNEHGGLGGRPIKIESCIAKGSPETSQACAQELVGKNVDMIMIGLDLFIDYATFAAANLPVIGVLPILPGDYTAEALFLTGGTAGVSGQMAAVAKEYFKAETVGIISADNAGANANEVALSAALDIAGIAHTTVKGGDNETDAGYQGLVRSAAESNPDLLVSLYAGDGCIGTMRGRAALGIEIPVITTGICSGKEVLSQVGDDAVGWSFVGVQTSEDTPEKVLVQEVAAPIVGVEPAEVDPTAFGLGALGMVGIMTLADFANAMVANGDEVTAQSLYDFLKASRGRPAWPAGAQMECGASPTNPSVCGFTGPVAQFNAGGGVTTIPGLEAVSSLNYLP